VRHYVAIVQDNADPDKVGRLQLEIPGLLDGTHPDWIPPRAPAGPGLVWIPRKDDRVIVERGEGGELRWLGATVRATPYADPFLKDYGKRHGIASADGAACVVVVNGGGVLVLAGSSGTITLATGEDATTEPVPLGRKLNDRIAALEDLLSSVFSTLSGACTAPPLSALKAGFDAFGTGAVLLPSLDLHLSRVTSTE